LRSKSGRPGRRTSRLSVILTAVGLVLTGSLAVLAARSRGILVLLALAFSVVASMWSFISAVDYRPARRRELGEKGRRVLRPPGFLLLRLAEFFCSPRTVTTVFQPTISDLQREYCEALGHGRIWKARWVCFRGWCSFWSAAAMRLPISLVRVAVGLWKFGAS